jgi:hypothetical protein
MMKTPLEPILSTPHVRPTVAVNLKNYLEEMQKQIHQSNDLAAMLSDQFLSFLAERKWSKANAIDFARGAGYAEAISDMLEVSPQLLTIVVLSAKQGPLELDALSELADFLSSFETVE